METSLPDNVAYEIEETPHGVWRRYPHANGERYQEYTSNRKMLGLPLLHITRGRCPETGKRKPACGIVAVGGSARGVVAVGQVAWGVVAVGQLAFGLIAVGQLAVSPLLGLGQLSTGVVALGQIAIGGLFALGQQAVGFVAVGQGALGWYVLAQGGRGMYVWDMSGASPEAERFFTSFLP